MRALESGFFHTPAAIGVSTPVGVAMYATLEGDGGVLGMGLAVASHCRVGIGVPHVMMASPPALLPSIDYPRAVDLLAKAIQIERAADLEIQSFGASHDIPLGQRAGRLRVEHVVPLTTSDPQAIAATFSQHHRRYARVGQKAGWELRELRGAEAHEAIIASQQTAAARALLRREYMSQPRLPKEIEFQIFDRAAAWGLTCFAAYEGHQLLSLALVGWAGRCAYDLINGSTNLGYQKRAAFWLQWRILSRLAEAGYKSYNLGGTSQMAADPNAAGYGLFQYKEGFGSQTAACRGGSWRFRPAHLAMHAVIDRARSLARGR